jgi:hypothetical protein
MPFYTFFLEFAGGTYISQVEAASPKLACVLWAKELNPEPIKGLGQNSKSVLIEEIEADEPVAVRNTSNVWCVSALVRGKLALVTLVQTENGKVETETNKTKGKNPQS